MILSPSPQQVVQPQFAAAIRKGFFINPRSLFLGSVPSIDLGLSGSQLAQADGLYEAKSVGRVLTFNGSTTYRYWDTPIGHDQSITLGAVFCFNSTPGADAVAVSLGSTTADAGGVWDAIGFDSATGKIAAWDRPLEGGSAFFQDGPTLTVGKFYCAVMHYIPSDATLSFFVDGVSYGTSAIDNVAGYDRGHFCLGGIRRLTALIAPAPVSVALAWYDMGRHYSSNKLLEWTAHPWSMFAPQRPFFSLGIAVGPSFQVAWARNANTAIQSGTRVA